MALRRALVIYESPFTRYLSVDKIKNLNQTIGGGGGLDCRKNFGKASGAYVADGSNFYTTRRTLACPDDNSS